MPDFNQQTKERDHGVIVLYQRADHQNAIWHTRIRIFGSTKHVRKSTRQSDYSKALVFAQQLYDQLVKKFQSTGSTQIHTFVEVANMYMKSLSAKNVPTEKINVFTLTLLQLHTIMVCGLL